MADNRILLVMAVLFLIGHGSAEGYIVEFSHDPVIRSNQPESLAAQQVSSQHEDFRKYVRNNRVPLKMEDTYSNTFNGISIETESSRTIQELRDLSYVKEIHEQQNYSVQLMDSVPLVGATEVWKNQVSGVNVTGEGVKVAVLDTGVAYNHSDLGNCTEQEFLDGNCDKVVDGYDFHNDDSDPMDDGGHGTHVAGTVAANGSIKGVAPGASISAYKVLGTQYGETDNIIAGIESAVNNGSDIISMSLGGSGNPDDALSQAADNAVESGVPVIVAAGNSYNHETIGSPGTALKALTVGATDNSDQIAGFSSLGPVPHNDTIFSKPDIVAPGVGVCAPYISDESSCKSGYYNSLQGTSMATPHVSGAAALLLQQDPSASASEIKSRLMLSADDAGYKPFVQGAGRLNVSRASDTDFYTTPQTLNLRNTTNRTYELSFTIHNEAQEDKTFDVNISDAFEYGGSDQEDVSGSSRITVGNNSSKEVSLSFNLDNLKGYYRGYINLTAQKSGYLVPYSLGRHFNHSFTSLNYSSKTSEQQATVNFSISRSQYNTSVRAYWDDGVKTVWENSSNTSGSVELPLDSGENVFNMSVARFNRSGFSQNRTITIVSDQIDPFINVSVYPGILDKPGETIDLAANYSDNEGVDILELVENSTGSWQVQDTVKVHGDVLTCSDIWGDCSIAPGQEDNTYGQCSPGESDFESVDAVRIDRSGGLGSKVHVDVMTDETYDSPYQIAVNGTDGWKVIDSGSVAGAVNTSFVPENPGEYTVRASKSYDNISGYCADESSWHDNDDVRFSMYNNADYRTQYSDTDGGRNWVGFRAKDAFNNTANDTKSFKVNEPPRLNFSLNASRYDGGSTAFFNYSAEDPEGEELDVFLNYTGPEENISKSLAGGNGEIDLEEGFGRANISVSAIDIRGATNYSNTSIYLKESVNPVSLLHEPYRKHRPIGHELNITYSATDNFQIANYTLMTNQSGSWEENSTIEEGDILFENDSYSGILKYGIKATDFFGNSDTANGTVRFRELNYSEDLYVRQRYDAELMVPYDVQINRSGWEFKPARVTVPQGVAVRSSDSFEEDNSYFNNSFQYSNESSEGEKSIKAEGSDAWVEFNFSSSRKTLLTYDLNHDGATLYVDGEYRENLYHTRGNWFGFETVLEPGNHTVRFENDGSELYLDNLELKDYRDYRSFDWTPKRVGNYTMSFQNSETGDMQNLTLYSNVSSLTGTAGKSIVPVNHTGNLSIKPQLSYVRNVSAELLSDPDAVNTTYINRTYSEAWASDEPHNDTRVITEVNASSRGFAQLQINLTARNGFNYSVEDEVLVAGRMNATSEVYDSQDEPLNATFAYGTEDELVDMYGINGSENRILANITEWANYSSFIEVNNSEDFYRAVYTDYPVMSENQEFELDSITDVEDGDYSFDILAYNEYTEAISDRFVFGDKTGTISDQESFICESFDPDSNSCSSSWKNVDLSITDEGGVTYVESPYQAVAFGVKQQDDDSDDGSDDSGGSGGSGGSAGGGYTPPPEPEMAVNSGEQGIQIENMDVDGSRNVEISHQVLDQLNFTGQAEQASVSITEAPEPEMDGKVVYTAIEINSSEDIGAEIYFTVGKDWLNDNRLSAGNVSLNRFEDGWERLETVIKENRTDTVSYRADTPGFSRFAIAADENSGCETGSFPAVENDACTVYTNRCNIPEDAVEVTSCSAWEEEQEAEEIVEEVDRDVESQKAEEKLQEAVEALEREEYDIAIQKATEARNIEKQSESSPLIYLLAVIVVGGLLGGSLLGYRYYSRKQTIRKLGELSELVRLEIKKGGVDNRRKVLHLLEQAEKDIENDEYGSAADRLDEITEHL